MRKLLVLLAISLFVFYGYSQESYKSSYGYVYNVGEDIYLGQPRGYHAGLRKSTFTIKWQTIFTDLGKVVRHLDFVNTKAIISKIDSNDDAKIYFQFNDQNYYVLIEKALSNNEVRFQALLSSQHSTNDKYDQIKKLKTLLDTGAITAEEYESEKIKLLKH